MSGSFKPYHALTLEMINPLHNVIFPLMLIDLYSWSRLLFLLKWKAFFMTVILACSDLREVYSALVKEGIISDSEFWKSRQNLVQKQLGTGGVKQQTVGLSSALLAQLQPEKSGKDKTV